MLLYADDTTLQVLQLTQTLDADTMQTHDQISVELQRQKQFIVNFKKIHFMVFGRKHRRKEISEAKLVQCNAELRPEKTVVCLSVSPT